VKTCIFMKKVYRFATLMRFNLEFSGEEIKVEVAKRET
jgi:hypothetical protein